MACSLHAYQTTTCTSVWPKAQRGRRGHRHAACHAPRSLSRRNNEEHIMGVSEHLESLETVQNWRRTAVSKFALWAVCLNSPTLAVARAWSCPCSAPCISRSRCSSNVYIKGVLQQLESLQTVQEGRRTAVSKFALWAGAFLRSPPFRRLAVFDDLGVLSWVIKCGEFNGAVLAAFW